MATHILTRRLTKSDLGCFDEPRRLRRLPGRQRALTFNKEVVCQLFPDAARAGSEVTFDGRCLFPGGPTAIQQRVLKLTAKNWRLAGDKIEGAVFESLYPDDFFVALLDLSGDEPFTMEWTVVMKATDPERHARLLGVVASRLSDNMLAVLAGEPLYGQLERECFTPAVPPPPPPTSALPPAVRVPPVLAPIPDRTVRERRPTVRERVRNPHILSEMMRVASHLSAQAQMDFLEVLQTIAEAVREALVKADAICEVEVNHGDFWRQVRGKRIAFVDGGVANLESLGSAPIAIRVGAYTVTPGERTDTREEFTFERVLISELYAPAGSGTGFYREEGDDPAQLRDAARFCLEVAGAWSLTTKSPPPDWLMIHGPLVNPVAMYRDLPPFSAGGLGHLLPAAERAGRKDRDAHFIPVYRRQLELLRAAGTNVCGVVERASGSRIAAVEWLRLLTDGGWVSSGFRREAEEKLFGFRISDPILFQVVLEPGEYLRPIAVDRNDVSRAPNEWVDVIRDYPKPLVSYVNVSDVALPLRVECFDSMPADRHEALFGLVVHSARLLPRYAFPAGLDIVDKHAKLPDWMARPVNARLATQMLQKAADRARESGNPRILVAMRQFLCGTTRDWLFRPKA